MQEAKSRLHAAARELAQQGYRIFPCVAGEKVPAVAHWKDDASLDLGQIDRWWVQNPNYNIGWSPEWNGLCAIDADTNKLGCAIDDLLLPDTRTHRTPSGGRHYLFLGSLPNSAGKLGHAVDTRGRGGYILLPPSMVNGNEYQIENPIAPVELPGEIAASFSMRDIQVAEISDCDTPGNINRARSLLAHLQRTGSIERVGGRNDRAYRLACEIQDLGISKDFCLSLLAEWNEWGCYPPLERSELEHVCHSAAEYRQNTGGVNAIGTAADVFSHLGGKFGGSGSETETKRSKFYFEDDQEQDNAPDPSWLIPDLIPDRSTILVVGETGSFKSFLIQDIALAVAAGKRTFGAQPTRTGPTFYGAHEVRDAIKKPRKQAWKLAREVTSKIPFYVAPGPHVINYAEGEEFREQVRVRLRQSTEKIGLIIIDTIHKSMAGLNENDAKDVGQFIEYVDSLRDEFDCSIVALHHTGKDENRGARGSSAMQAGFDTTLRVKRPNKKMPYVFVEVVQHATAAEREEPFYFEGKPFMGTLVFDPIEEAEFTAALKGDDPYDRKKAGAALQRLNAIGREKGVTTRVLTTEMMPHDELDTTEQQAAAIDKAERELQRLAKSTLSAYCERDGRSLLWFLPSA